MILRTLLAALALSASAWTASAADLELWRLDCGRIAVKDLSMFSDSFAYQGQSRLLTDSCYLIRHDETYMLWDTGLPSALLGAKLDPNAPIGASLDKTLPDQLAEIGLKPEAVSLVGISHDHFDHLGQAASFPKARLIIGRKDFEQLKAGTPVFGVEPALARPWTQGGGSVDPVDGDKDVFGDGSVVVLATPGHTSGAQSLLVRLARKGAVLLSGDTVHFEEQFANRGVPPFNTDRAESLASMERLQAISVTLKATLVVQHDASDIAKLPTFPASAK